MQVREMRTEDVREFALLYRGAYPGTGVTLNEAIEAMERRMAAPDMQLLIAVDDSNKILGGLTLFDFTIYHGTSELKMGGIGAVAVGLDAKKHGVAKVLLEDTLKRMKEADVPVSILYPFRHDFYQQMGWGQVGEVKEFKFLPASLPVYPERQYVRRFADSDLEGLKLCYDEVARQGNCMIKRADYHWERKLKPVPDLFVFEKDGQIQGYMQVAFIKNPTSFLNYEMEVQEIIYTTQEAYFGLLGFISSQHDQMAAVIHYTQRTDPFHHLLKEPRRSPEVINGLYHNSQRIGAGWMYRLVDVEKAMTARTYNDADLDVTFVLEDSFLPENSDNYHLTLSGGKPTLVRGETSKYQVKTDISTFAQLFTNYLTFSQAAQIRKIEISDPAIIPQLEAAFKQPEPRMLHFF